MGKVFSCQQDVLPRRVDLEHFAQDNPEKLKSINFLQEIGLLVPVSQLDLYHGRAKSSNETEEWSVNPDFDNSGNITGNYNVNKISALNTDTYEVAQEFAEARTLFSSSTPEVKKIISSDPHAMIIDLSSYYEIFQNTNKPITQKFRNKAQKAIASLIPLQIKSSPLPFDNRYDLNNIKPHDIVANGNPLVFENKINDIAKQLNKSPELVRQLAGILNTRCFLESTGPENFGVLISHLLDDKSSVKVASELAPISQDFLVSFMKENHIIGVKRAVNSVTIGKTIEPVVFFDLEKVNTEQQLSKQRQEENRLFGAVTIRVIEQWHDQLEAKNHSDFLDFIINDHMATPEQIMTKARQVGNFEQIFASDAGNWEKFTIGEHTETVLRIFDQSYADNLPVDVLPIMKLVILTHDIGKAEAIKQEDKKNQHHHNKVMAGKFLSEAKVDQATIDLIIGIIGDAQILTTQAFIRGNSKAEKSLRQYSIMLAKNFNQGKALSDQEITAQARGIYNMCLILQTCDSAAYTDMAVTRNEKTGIYYKNYPSFNQSFESKTNSFNRQIKFKTIS